MEQITKTEKPARPRRGKALFVTGLASAILLMATGVALGAFLLRKPDPLAVEQSFTTFIEGIAPASKIVLVEARHRLVISRTTPARLFGDSGIGKLLDIRSDATVETSAFAELAFAIDLDAPEGWAVRYDPENGGRVILSAPPLGMFTPTVLTNTIEVRTVDKSLLLDELALERSAIARLTQDFIEAAVSLRDDPSIRAEAAGALESIVMRFAAETGTELAAVEVSFATAED